MRLLVIGFILGVAVSVGALALHDGQVVAAIEAQDRHADSLTAALLVAEHERRSALEEQAKANARADAASAKAEAIANRMGRYKPLTVADVDSAGYALVTRATDRTQWRAPVWLIQERQQLVRDLWQMKYAWEAERAARKLAVDVTIPRVVLRSDVGDKLAESLREGIRLRDERDNPRCGRKCGIVIGVLSTTAAALVLDRVQQLAQ